MTLRRFLARRRFYLLLPGIVLDRLRAGRRDGVFVSLMGGVGDLVNAFPALEALSARSPVDLGTGGGPYRAIALANPHLRRVYAPFVYKPIRRHHRLVIERVLSRVYERVVLLDEPAAGLPDEEAVTIAGLVLYEAKRIPDVGQAFLFHGFRFEILRRHRHQITAVRVTPPPAAPAA